MWTAENRARYERKGRYPSDVTDEEWVLVAPHLPPERRTDQRAILNAILYVLTTGCQWRALPKDFPPKSTVHDYFVEWHCDGTLTRLHHALYAEVRELAGKKPAATTHSRPAPSGVSASERRAPVLEASSSEPRRPSAMRTAVTATSRWTMP